MKRIDSELEKHQEQLLDYSFKQGVGLAVLTNGITWWFYLPLREGSWEQRKFYSIHILQQDTNEIAVKFIDFLAKDNIHNGTAIENAEAILKDQQKVSIIEETLPKAWNKIIEEADELLVDLLNETAEAMCGFKADTELVEDFLAENKARLIILPSTDRSTSLIPLQTISEVVVSERDNIGGYTNKNISYFYFCSAKYEARSWKDLLIKLCECILLTHRNDFDKTLTIRGRKRPYFARNYRELRAPELIKGTDIYVETNLSANNIVKVCKQMIAVFGYAENHFKVVTSSYTPLI